MNSRLVSLRFSAVEWAAILRLANAGAEAFPSDAAVTAADDALTEVDATVQALRELEPLGCGLDHPDNAYLVDGTKPCSPSE